MPGECLFFVHLCFTCKSYFIYKKKTKNKKKNKTSHQLCSLFPSLTAMLRSFVDKICYVYILLPLLHLLQTPRLLTFSRFSNQRFSKCKFLNSNCKLLHFLLLGSVFLFFEGFQPQNVVMFSYSMKHSHLYWHLCSYVLLCNAYLIYQVFHSSNPKPSEIRALFS